MRDLGQPISATRLGDADDVRTFIRQHTSLQADTVDPLGAGMGSVAWRVDGEWVARFPVTADATVGLETELSLVPLLGDALPVPVPDFEHVVRSRGGGAIMTAYRLLDGVPLSLAARAALSDNARARVLDELSAIIGSLPPDRARAAGAQLHPHQGFGHPSQRALHRRNGAQLGSDAVARVEALWRAYETGSRYEHAAADALAHADLKPEHVLHDPTSGQITALLDWGDACLSHAHFDLAVIGLFFDTYVRDELAGRLPNVNAQHVAHDAELLVVVRWLCDLELGAAEGDEPFQTMCVAGLRAHLDALA